MTGVSTLRKLITVRELQSFTEVEGSYLQIRATPAATLFKVLHLETCQTKMKTTAEKLLAVKIKHFFLEIHYSVIVLH